jgi:hypothetical protein
MMAVTRGLEFRVVLHIIRADRRIDAQGDRRRHTDNKAKQKA